jgi:hypothetical protein
MGKNLPLQLMKLLLYFYVFKPLKREKQSPHSRGIYINVDAYFNDVGQRKRKRKEHSVNLHESK